MIRVSFFGFWKSGKSTSEMGAKGSGEGKAGFGGTVWVVNRLT